MISSKYKCNDWRLRSILSTAGPPCDEGKGRDKESTQLSLHDLVFCFLWEHESRTTQTTTNNGRVRHLMGHVCCFLGGFSTRSTHSKSRLLMFFGVGGGGSSIRWASILQHPLLICYFKNAIHSHNEPQWGHILNFSYISKCKGMKFHSQAPFHIVSSFNCFVSAAET